MDYRRRKHTYSFRAWIDERGSNCDGQHGTWHGGPGVARCHHLRLWDLNTMQGSHNIIRIVRRRRPFALGIYLGKMMRARFQIGLPR